MGGDDSDVETSAADDDPADEDEFHYPEVFRAARPAPPTASATAFGTLRGYDLDRRDGHAPVEDETPRVRVPGAGGTS